MEIVYTEEFRRAYLRLTALERRLVDGKLRFLANDYRHPSLRAAKWEEPNV